MLTDTEKANFHTLKTAFLNGEVALLECTDAMTGERVPTLVAVNYDGEEYEMVPLGRMLTGNPYDQLLPPD